MDLTRYMFYYLRAQPYVCVCVMLTACILMFSEATIQTKYHQNEIL